MARTRAGQYPQKRPKKTQAQTEYEAWAAKQEKPKSPTEAQKQYVKWRKSLAEKNNGVGMRSPNQFGKKDSPETRELFLGWLRSGATVALAASQTGVSHVTVHAWRKKDPDFATAWEDALAEGTGVLEQEAIRRGYHGVDRPVFQGGEVVGFVREYSDTLLIKTLEARDPSRFSNRHNVAMSGKVEVVDHGAAAALQHILLGLVAQNRDRCEGPVIEADPPADRDAGPRLVLLAKAGPDSTE